MSGKLGAIQFVIAWNQQGFEEREQVLFSLVLGGTQRFTCAGLGWLLARRVMAPVIPLSWQVRNREPAPLL